MGIQSSSSAKRGRGRDYYDEIQNLAPGGTFPNCMARDAAALDHYLPRAHFPVVALQPTNLLPMCTACNGSKLGKVATVAHEQFLHPYFDRLGGSDWLGVTVREEPSSPVVFSVVRPTRWDDQLHARVVKHFERYGLSGLYGKKAAALLGNYRLAFETLFTDAPEGGGPNMVAREAARFSASYESEGQYPWAAAALRGWSESSWFCNGGWRIEQDTPLADAIARLSSTTSTLSHEAEMPKLRRSVHPNQEASVRVRDHARPTSFD